MPRIRNVKPEFFTDADLGALSPVHRLLFEGLWCHADRDGRLEDRPRDLKVKILPFDDCDVDALLEDLAHAKMESGGHGFIRRYAAGGKRYLQVEKLAEHQKFHPSEKSRGLPGPPDVDTTPTPAGPAPASVEQVVKQCSAGVQQVASRLLDTCQTPASRPETETEVSETETEVKSFAGIAQSATPADPAPAFEPVVEYDDDRPAALTETAKAVREKQRLARAHALKQQLMAIFLEARGCAYDWRGAKDSLALNRLAVRATDDEVLRRWRIGLAGTFQQECHGVATLDAKWNALAQAGPPTKATGAMGKGPVRAEDIQRNGTTGEVHDW